MTNQEIIQEFEQGRAPAGSLHHADHIRVAFAYLSQYSVLEALQKFCAALQRFAVAQGKPHLYHETITWAYLFLIRQRMLRAGDPQTWEEFAAANPDLITWERETAGFSRGTITRRLWHPPLHGRRYCFRTRPSVLRSSLLRCFLFRLLVRCGLILNSEPTRFGRLPVFLPRQQFRETAFYFTGLDVAVSATLHILLNEELACARLARDQKIVARYCGRDNRIVAGVNRKHGTRQFPCGRVELLQVRQGAGISLVALDAIVDSVARRQAGIDGVPVVERIPSAALFQILQDVSEEYDSIRQFLV